MEPTIEMKIKLTPKLVFDKETNTHIATFTEVPQAIAYDNTEYEALMRLIEITRVMLQENKDYFMQQFIENKMVNLQSENFDVNLLTA